MKPPAWKKINTFLQNDNQDLRFLLSKVKHLQALKERVLALITPVDIRTLCDVANIEKNKLTLLAANGSVATQLKFQTSLLLQQFKREAELKHIVEIQIKLTSYEAFSRLQTKTATVMQYLSQETAQIVHDIAQSIDDLSLREVLERIATRTK